MQPLQRRSIDEPPCPVSDGVLSRLYRADESNVDAIALELPGEVRVDLAIYCYGRAHLRDRGLQIAALCDKDDLRRAGNIGLHLCTMPEARSQMVRHKSGITLATVDETRVREAASADADDDDLDEALAAAE